MASVWEAWAERWEAFQDAYVPCRSEQFGTVTSYLAQWCGPGPRVLDLCCGPGSMGKRVLAESDASTVVGVDLDPWLLELARRTTDGRRATWAPADLRTPDWSRAVEPEGPFDAVTFTTATHWLEPRVLAEVYAEAARLLAGRGPLFVVDLIPDIADAHGRARLPVMRVLGAQASASRAGETWPQFWEAAAREPTFTTLLEERKRLLPPRREGLFLSLDKHVEALHAAGLTTVTQLWRRDASAVIAALP